MTSNHPSSIEIPSFSLNIHVEADLIFGAEKSVHVDPARDDSSPRDKIRGDLAVARHRKESGEGTGKELN